MERKLYSIVVNCRKSLAFCFIVKTFCWEKSKLYSYALTFKLTYENQLTTDSNVFYYLHDKITGNGPRGTLKATRTNEQKRQILV